MYCADRHRRWRRIHDASARLGEHTHIVRSALFVLFFVFFLLCFSCFLSAASFLFFVLFFVFSPPVFVFVLFLFCFVLFLFFVFGWALDKHAMDRRFHKNERRQRRREEPSRGSEEAHVGAMANRSPTDELRSHGITVSAYPATSATQRRERCERECCSSSAGTRRLVQAPRWETACGECTGVERVRETPALEPGARVKQQLPGAAWY